MIFSEQKLYKVTKPIISVTAIYIWAEHSKEQFVTGLVVMRPAPEICDSMHLASPLHKMLLW